MRSVLTESQLTPGAQKGISEFHGEIVREIQVAIQKNDWVIVGMRQNPVVKGARKFMDSKNIKYKYIEHGSYFSMWKQRLAIKLWSGWPTFPQVFHHGKLVGGLADLKVYPGLK